MKKANCYSICFLFLIITPCFAGSITCRGLHYGPDKDVLLFSLAAASISNEKIRTRILGDERDDINLCAQTLRHKICSDGMIMGLLDKSTSIAGGAVGLLWGGTRNGSVADGMLAGALLGGLAGTTAGTIKFAQCNQYLAEDISPIADRLAPLPGGKGTLQLFLDGIENSATGRSATISGDQARYLRAEIQKWAANFQR